MTHTSDRRGSWSILCIGTLLLMAPTRGAAQEQTLQLSNGDRVTGHLLRIDAGTWVFRFAGAETQVAAARVAAFTAPQPIGVRLADGTVGAATVQPAEGQLQLTLADGTMRTVAPAALEAVGDPANLRALRPVAISFFSPFFKYWRARGSLGFSDKSGNSRARGVAASVEIVRSTAKDRIKLVLGLAREQSESASGTGLETTVNRYYGSLRTDVFFTTRFFAFGETRQERDTFQDIDLRSFYNGGIGVQLVATKITDLRLSASGGARVERFTSGGSETAPVLTTGTDLRQKLGPATLAWDLVWLPNVEDLGDYQLRSDASITTTVYKGLGIRLGLLNEFDSRPRPGIDKHDMLVTTTLTYSIGG